MAAMYATAPREAWRLESRSDLANCRPVSFDALTAAGWEPAAKRNMAPRSIITVVANLMVEVGWERAVAEDVMEAVAQAAPWGPASGWRWVANRVDAEPWQVRRLIDLLLGVRGGPSVVTLMQTPNDETLRAHFRRRLEWTLHKRRPLAPAAQTL